MAEPGDWTSQPIPPRQQSQRSFARTLASSRTSASHRRIASDDFSLSCRSQADETFELNRPSTVSPEPRQWLPIMGASGVASPTITMTSEPVWSDGGDLGSGSFPTSPKRAPSFSQPQEGLDGFQSVPVSASQSTRPKPAPMQFEDVPADYYSPAPSSRSFFSPRGRFQHSRTNSHTNLLSTPSTIAWRSPRTPPPYSAAIPLARRWWHWRPAWFMYVSFFFGVACAIGHHIFYKSLDGKPAVNQLAMLRYGTVISFAAKAGLVAAVVMAFRQRIWATVRSKFLSVAALDSLFAATEDVTAMLNFEIYKRAKIAVLLAMFVWLTPLVIILTGNTLTMELALWTENTTCPGIRTLNFTMDAIEEWRQPTKINGWYGLSLSYWNKTSEDTGDPYWFDYYTGPTNPLTRVTNQAAYLGQAVGYTGASVDICGAGWNCSYTINFTAPAYKCTELASGVGSEVKPLGNQKPPVGFNTKLILPEGNFSYYAYTSGGDYAFPQMKDSGPGGIPTTGPPFPKNLGAFRTEPVLWIGYAVRTDPDGQPPLNRTMPGWNEAFIPKVMGCEHYVAHYTVAVNLTSGHQFTNVTEREFLYPVMNTTWIQGKDADDGTADNTTAVPASNYVYPANYSNPTALHQYREIGAYHSLGSCLRDFLNGTMNSAQLDNPIQVTKLDQTKLLDQSHDYFLYTNISSMIEEFYQDMILSLFSNQQFVSVVWAAQPHRASGKDMGDEETRYPCVRSRSDTNYVYHERDLWIVYCIAILLAGAGVAAGTLTVLENQGVLRSTRFSSIVAATRGPALEKLGWHGSEDLPRDVKNVRVGYGLVHRAGSGLGVLQEEDSRYPERVVWGGGDVHYGFGLEGDVRQMRSEGSIFRQR
ncbi:hypothetical protein F5Y04DRAFT_52790 [Hypomontagnella monticulosa]|nr:hypothetical protein F5Y04DRAFT_52790 [Hypomontagnella monticulosa]